MSLDKFIRKEVRNLASYHLDEQQGVKLNQNESPWDLPVELKARVVEALLRNSWNRYPLGEDLRLTKKLAKYLNVWADNIVMANGSNVLIQAILLATSIGKKVLVTDPAFSVYEHQATLLGNKIIRVPLETGFRLPLDAMLETMKKEKPSVIFIANPNAPTGNCFETEVLKKIVSEASCPVVIDEAYYPFSGFTVIDWLKEFEHLIILRTFSKAFALGGLRFGYLLTEPELAREIEKCLLPFRMSRLILATIEVALDHTKYVDDYVQKIIAERKRVFDAMLQISKITAFPSDTNFILFTVENAPAIFKKLLDEKVVIRQVSDGRSLQNALRVSIGTKDENDTFLKALQKSV